MTAVNFKIPFFAKPANPQFANKNSSPQTTISAPAPSVETAGSVASAAPASSSTFCTTC